MVAEWERAFVCQWVSRELSPITPGVPWELGAEEGDSDKFELEVRCCRA